jgi:hypothetical protein
VTNVTPAGTVSPGSVGTGKRVFLNDAVYAAIGWIGWSVVLGDVLQFALLWLAIRLVGKDVGFWDGIERGDLFIVGVVISLSTIKMLYSARAAARPDRLAKASKATLCRATDTAFFLSVLCAVGGLTVWILSVFSEAKMSDLLTIPAAVPKWGGLGFFVVCLLLGATAAAFEHHIHLLSGAKK